MSKLWLLLNTIFVVLFNTTFFVSSGFSHSAPVWITYAFIHVAYAAALISPSLIPRTKSQMILGFTLDGISLGYFFLELLIGVIIIFLSPEGWKLPFIGQFFLFCTYLFIFIANLIANKHTIENEKQSLNELAYHKTVCSKLSALLDLSISSEIRKKIEKLYDNSYSSQTKSHQSMAELETKILTQIDLLEKAIIANNDGEIIVGINNISALLSKRSQELRLMN